jgi:hypothetical protein
MYTLFDTEVTAFSLNSHYLFLSYLIIILVFPMQLVETSLLKSLNRITYAHQIIYCPQHTKQFTNCKINKVYILLEGIQVTHT